jgi:hypothetical protein
LRAIRLCRREHDADQQILAGLPVQQVQDKKIDKIVDRYRINTKQVFQE